MSTQQTFYQFSDKVGAAQLIVSSIRPSGSLRHAAGSGFRTEMTDLSSQSPNDQLATPFQSLPNQIEPLFDSDSSQMQISPRDVNEANSSAVGVTQQETNRGEGYSALFTVRGKSTSAHARLYLRGLLSPNQDSRRNLERIRLNGEKADYQALQQFISDSPWSHEFLMLRLREELAEQFRGQSNRMLLLEEVSFPKKGNASVAVEMQYSVRVGKPENCQVGIFASLGCDAQLAIIDFQLYLTKAWASDEGRCERTKIPPLVRTYRTKTQLALSALEKLPEDSYDWLAGGKDFGRNLKFCRAIEDRGESYVFDAAQDVVIYTADPSPDRNRMNQSGETQEAVHRPTGFRRVLLYKLVESGFARNQRSIPLTQSGNPADSINAWVCPVWRWDEKSPQAHPCYVVATQHEGLGYSYSLVHASKVKLSWEQMVGLHLQRIRQQDVFARGCQALGLSHYEIRGWRGWHHHMAMVCLASLICLKEGQDPSATDWKDDPERLEKVLKNYLPELKKG